MEEAYLAKWKLFGRSKKEEDSKGIDIPTQVTEEVLQPEHETTTETTEETEESPVTEHHETLYSKGQEPKSKAPTQKSEEPWKRSNWENADTIEKNVDTIDKKKTDYTQKSSTPKDVEEKVDKLLSKKKI